MSVNLEVLENKAKEIGIDLNKLWRHLADFLLGVFFWRCERQWWFRNYWGTA